MKQTYIRCPRCELNYILKKDKLCNVCKSEMKALGTMGQEENMDMELCPICKINYITPDEDMCPACAKEREYDDSDTVEGAREGVWGYDDEVSDDDGYSEDENGDMVSIGSLGDSDDEIDIGIDDDDDEPLDAAFDDDDDDDSFDDDDDDDDSSSDDDDDEDDD